jgi:pSer/pThr/pTyr-binding forkhead associated (FHA) protein
MLKGLGTNFMVSYKKDELENSLIISSQNIESFRKNRVDILKRCFINFLPLHISRGRDQFYFKYNTADKIKLSEYIKNKKLKIKTFLNILSEITNIIKKANVNKLDSNSIVIDEEAIYIDPKTQKIYMIYVPMDLESDTIGNLKSFMVNLIMFLTKFEDSKSEDYIQKIIYLLKSSKFNVFALDELISDLKELNEEEEKKANEEEIDTKMISDFSRKINEVESKIINHHKDRMVNDKNQDKDQILLNKILIQVLIIVVIALTIVLTNLYNLLDKMYYIYIASSVAGVLVSVILWKDYFTKTSDEEILINLLNDGVADNKISQPVFSASMAGDQTIINEDTMFLDNYGDIKNNYSDRLSNKDKKREMNFFKGTKKQELSKNLDRSIINSENIDNYKADNGNINSNNAIDNSIITRKPIIEIDENGLSKKIEIDKSEFVVGRLKGSVDLFTGNAAVGRKHAKIININNSYYLVDLESRNGTFLNGKRVRSNVEYLLKDKDELMFANTKIKIYL